MYREQLRSLIPTGKDGNIPMGIFCAALRRGDLTHGVMKRVLVFKDMFYECYCETGMDRLYCDRYQDFKRKSI